MSKQKRTPMTSTEVIAAIKTLLAEGYGSLSPREQGAMHSFVNRNRSGGWALAETIEERFPGLTEKVRSELPAKTTDNIDEILEDSGLEELLS
jgi:hypothetical protein